MTSVLLSIKPKYVEAIMSKKKHYEFRKKIFIQKIDRIYIYATAPVKKIVASFEVELIIKAPPSQLWKKFGNVAGIERKDFFDYYEDCRFGYAIKIKKVRKLSIPINPKEKEPGFTPPQSYQYIDMKIK